MPRSPSGDYTLPLPPVITGTAIEASWANTSLADMAQALTDSLSRTNQGSMQDVFRAIDGTKAAPAIGFSNEAGTGWFRPNPGDLRVAVLGTEHVRITSTDGVELTTDDGVTWYPVISGAEYDVLAAQVDQNTIDISANTDSIVILSNQIIALGVNFVTDSFKSNGSIRHLLRNSLTIDVNAATRHSITNFAGVTLNFTNVPSADDPDLGDTYQVEGQMIVWNDTGGAITLGSGLPGDTRVLGVPNPSANAVSVLSYMFQYIGGTMHATLIWSAE